MFLLVNDNENNVLVFSTIDTILTVDGTFKSCPKLFTHFFQNSVNFIKWKLHTINFFFIN